jgi:hypothetical protein
LRARPEQTQSGNLSDASFLGKLLVLPANVRLDWKVISRCKHSSLFGNVFCNKEKKFCNIATRFQDPNSKDSIIFMLDGTSTSESFQFTSGYNFTNILQAAFVQKFFAQLLCPYNLGL